MVIGNPPYNANQANENDNNKNREHPAIDARIKQTYIAESTAQKTKLYDMYARFFRWASDRLDANGVLAFVTNRSFIDSRTFDGFRKTVAREFAEIRIVDLGGEVRANPKLSGTRHNVFGIQTGVAISFLVKKSGPKERCCIFYARRPEMETALVRCLTLNGVPTEDDGRALVREMLLSSADIVPQAEEQRLLVRVHSLASPRHNHALAKLCETLNSLEIRYPGTDLMLTYEAPQVA